MIQTLASAYLAILSAYHIWSGGISYFAPDFALRFYRGMYGCDPIERRHLRLILRPWGALAIFAGAAGVIALTVEEARMPLMAAICGLLTLRIGYRLRLARELQQLAAITPQRNMLSIILLAAGALILGADLARIVLSS